ncbi:hypothetical protein [Roseovarius albus]|nr:hypothetical protein [Roseovarius albus]
MPTKKMAVITDPDARKQATSLLAEFMLKLSTSENARSRFMR